ncbi:hypothetical protein WJX72_003908 [[Myrmecia] bisecta]|uniref:Translation initiation factor eIF2B subunit alpha n=1 Tax=[Myrmecia] bisecta TaxID=41462 RepID=A0AAW1PWY1_9CHLO
MRPQYGPSITQGFHSAPYPRQANTAANTGNASESIVREFHEALARAPEMAVAVAAIKALTSVITKSTAQTAMGLEKELKEAAASLQRCNETAISLKAGCELFLRYTTRTSALEMEDFATAKARIIERGNYFAETSTRARQTIAELGARFIQPGAVVLCHGHSRVVLALLRRAVAQGVQFSVVVTEGRPDGTGLTMARALDEMHVPVVAILDSAVAFALESLKVNMVMVGAEGVVENGGVINKLGTYQIAIAAKVHNIPFYVAAESYKFARLYPLSQRDLPVERKHVDFGPLMPKAVKIENPSRDYTPPSYISLLFTDLGVLTPAAVSDELIQLYV